MCGFTQSTFEITPLSVTNLTCRTGPQPSGEPTAGTPGEYGDDGQHHAQKPVAH